MTLELGEKAPDFHLMDTVSGVHVCLEDVNSAHALLVMFVCNHCPFVIHVEEELAKLGRHYGPQGVAMVAICSNDVKNYPADAPDKMLEFAREKGWNFPYLYDEDQSVAKAYFAACTPDFYLFDSEQRLVYRGQLDGSRPGNDVPVSGGDLRSAIDAVLNQAPVESEQKPSIGCNIKWIAGQEPTYYG
jgi:peroxiredoxin